MKNLAVTCTLLLIVLIAGKSIFRSTNQGQPIVAITQIIDHPALDQEREGILLALKEAGYQDGKNVKIIYQNAQGSMTTAAQIAQKMVSLQPHVIVAISTPSAQSMLSVIGNNKIPLVFTAVTDPVEAKLVKTLDRPNDWVTGVSDYLPPEPQLELVKRFVPNLKNLGVVYNPGETNSVVLVQQLKTLAAQRHMNLISATASRTSEVASAAQSLVGRVDAIYIPNDNTAVAAIESIIQVGFHHRIPVFAGDEGSVNRGAVAMAGYDRRKLGKQAGEMVVRILGKESPRQIPVHYRHPIETIANPASAEKMGVRLPEGNRL